MLLLAGLVDLESGGYAGSRWTSGGNTATTTKNMPVVRRARTGRLAPAADPMAATTQIDAAVVRPPDRVAADEDQPGAQEPDPGHDLRGHP